MNVNLINIPRSEHRNLRKTVEDLLKKYQVNPGSSVNISFANKFQIKALNKKYLKKNQATDVLSFPIWSRLAEIPTKGKVALGDIFICPEMSNPNQLQSLVKHGLGHLLGKHH